MQNPTVRILSYHAGQWDRVQKSVIRELSVTLTVNNDPWLAFMCTPHDLDALAVGFLYNEGIVETLGDIANIRVCPGEDNVDVWLNRSVEKPKTWARTSGCSGGKASIGQNDWQSVNVINNNGGVLAAEAVGKLVEKLGKAQELYRETGGVHTSALSNGEDILLVAEDIGRHNTLDKIAGQCLLGNISPSRRILLTTGRISSEMMQKAGRMKVSVVISRTSPSSLSVEMAEKQWITLIGYAQRDKFTVYTHPERIIDKKVVGKIASEA